MASTTKKKSSSSSKKKEYHIPQRSVLQEGRDTIQVMRESYPAMLDLQQRYDPEFARSEVATAEARAGAETAVISRLGPERREALLDASPEMRLASDNMQRDLKATGPSAIETEMNRQAMADLQLGGRLSNEENRDAVQSARAGMSARGLAGGQPGVIAEVLNRAAFSTARQAERRGFASSVDAQTNQREEADRNYSLNALDKSASIFDAQQRIFGTGGSASSGVVQGTAAFTPYAANTASIGASNQQAAIAAAGMAQAEDQFNINRQDTLKYNEQQRRDGISANNANNAAAKSAANKQAAGAVAGAVVMGAIVIF